MGDNGQALHSVFTVVAPVRPERVAELQSVLDTISASPADNDVLPFGRLPGLHYSSLVLFPARAGRAPLLVLESNVDGTVAGHLRRMVDVADGGIDQVWGGCVDYPLGGTGSDDVEAWLEDRVVLPGAYHVGATGRGRAQIEAEAELRAEIEDHLDAVQAAGTLPGTALAIRESVRAHLQRDPRFAWALEPGGAGSKPRLIQRIERVVHVATSSDRTLVKPLVVGGSAFVRLARRSPKHALVTLLVGAGGVVAWLRWRERADPNDDEAVPDEHLDAIEAAEDRAGVAVNHLASLVDLKPGIGRHTLLRGTLFAIDVAGRTVFTKGELGGIPSIHFAHWSIVDDGRRLLFVSNFDGSWESYLDDFIEKAASGLTAVWSNTRNFPRCRWLGIPGDGGGARQGPAFKRIARNSQSPTTIHFTAYPELTVSNIQRNTAIRLGLVGERDEEDAQAWLSKL